MHELKALIKGRIGRSVICLDTVDSTNTFAMELGGRDAEHGTAVIAERQTKGKGRLGREWASPPGRNIAMSVLLRPSMPIREVTLLTVMASVACCRTLREATGLSVTIKWPNDLMVGGRKVGGILTEMKSAAERMIFAVIGIGINLNSEPADFPPDVRATATSVKTETGREHSKTLVIAGICNELESWYEVLVSKGRQPLLDEWRNLSSMLGKPVSVATGKETLRGIAKDIDDQGMLILELPSGAAVTLRAGDVTALRERE